MIKKVFTGYQNILDNPAMDSGLQNDKMHDKAIPAYSSEAELASGKKAPVGLPENKMQDNVIGQENDVSYFNNPRKPVGYVEQSETEFYATPKQTEPLDAHNSNSSNFLEAQRQQNLQAITQQNKSNYNTKQNFAGTSSVDVSASNHQAENIWHHRDELNQLSQQVMSKQDVLDLLTSQNKPNLAGRFAAMSAHVGASDMTDENKNDVQQKLNIATLKYAERIADKDIELINISVQQQTRQSNFELG